MKDTPNSATDISAEEIYKTVVSSGQSALNAFLTMNGGASLAFLAFIGNALKERILNEVVGGEHCNSIIAGTFAAVCAFGTIFLTNCFSSIGCHGMRKLMFGITLLFGFASLGLFVGASATAINGFTAAKLVPPTQGTLHQKLFDTRSGRILSIHHGAMDAKEARGGAQCHTQYHTQHDAKISDEHVAVITVPSDTAEQGKQYKVDVSRKALVATEGKDGVGFGFGVTGRSS